MQTITEEDFVQYRAMREEIEVLKRQLREARTKSVADTVRGSGKEYPYTEHTVTIIGYDERRAARLEERIRELSATCEAIDALIQGLKRSSDRLILSMRYIEGRTWDEIGRTINLAGDTTRKRTGNILKKIL